MAEQTNWSSQQDEILIDFVRNHEALFNVKSSEHRKTKLKTSLWREIGAMLSKTDTDCNKRWAYIRDYYIRKRGKPSPGSVGEAVKKRSELLSFLDDCPIKRRTASYIENNEETSESSQEDTDQIDTPIISKIDSAEEQSYTTSRNVCTLEPIKSEIYSTPSIASTSRTTSPLAIFAPRPQHVQGGQDENDLFFASMATIVKNYLHQNRLGSEWRLLL
ncbi:uncharacterized protein LOC115881426 [Sitophilus oryzae]|uniref:Uncharacterized protein LOC115881426 n=1 Tax=Sitophilus oryzae TaxID=7048 RepID=A0A6J2XTB1_SITOR|nr:uncharacterized protein LOC115881426 [Sitophilus oryzae]